MVKHNTLFAEATGFGYRGPAGRPSSHAWQNVFEFICYAGVEKNEDRGLHLGGILALLGIMSAVRHLGIAWLVTY